MVDNSSEGLDRTLHALGDPTRRALLARLRAGSATVGELAEPFAISLAAVSKHVRVLEDAGLLAREVRGREHHLRLDARPMRAIDEFTEEYRRFWDARLDALDAHLRSDPGTGAGSASGAHAAGRPKPAAGRSAKRAATKPRRGARR